MSVTNHNNSGRGLPGPILGIKILLPGDAAPSLISAYCNVCRGPIRRRHIPSEIDTYFVVKL